MNTVSFLNIITPCSRPHNLHKISRSINIPRENYRWIVVFDSPEKPHKMLIPDNAETYCHQHPLSCFGHAQRNYALQLIESGHVYFNDDDTTIHPLLWSNIHGKSADFISLRQNTNTGQPRLTGDRIEVGHIDSHNFIVSANIAHKYLWKFIYEADGHFAATCHADSTQPLHIDKVLSIYNSLR